MGLEICRPRGMGASLHAGSSIAPMPVKIRVGLGGPHAREGFLQRATNPVPVSTTSAAPPGASRGRFEDVLRGASVTSLRVNICSTADAADADRLLASSAWRTESLVQLRIHLHAEQGGGVSLTLDPGALSSLKSIEVTAFKPSDKPITLRFTGPMATVTSLITHVRLQTPTPLGRALPALLRLHVLDDIYLGRDDDVTGGLVLSGHSQLMQLRLSARHECDNHVGTTIAALSTMSHLVELDLHLQGAVSSLQPILEALVPLASLRRVDIGTSLAWDEPFGVAPAALLLGRLEHFKVSGNQVEESCFSSCAECYSTPLDVLQGVCIEGDKLWCCCDGWGIELVSSLLGHWGVLAARAKSAHLVVVLGGCSYMAASNIADGTEDDRLREGLPALAPLLRHASVSLTLVLQKGHMGLHFYPELANIVRELVVVQEAVEPQRHPRTADAQGAAAVLPWPLPLAWPEMQLLERYTLRSYSITSMSLALASLRDARRFPALREVRLEPISATEESLHKAGLVTESGPWQGARGGLGALDNPLESFTSTRSSVAVYAPSALLGAACAQLVRPTHGGSHPCFALGTCKLASS